MIDLEEDSKALAPSDTALAKISTLAEKQVMLELKILGLTETMKDLQEELRKVQEYELPDAMDEAGVTEFKLLDGAKITVKPFYSAKITDQNREPCFSWLRDNDHGDLIKHEVVASLGKGQDDLSTEVRAFFNLNHIPYVDKEGVHHSTLNAFVKEQIEGATNFPQELFQAFVGRKTKITTK